MVAPDPPASGKLLGELQSKIQLELPPGYAAFLEEFGGGMFGLTNIFSAHPISEFYLPRRITESSSYLPGGLLPFSDDYSGGLYVFQIRDGQVLSVPKYWNHDGGVVETRFRNIFEFIARYAYESA